MLGTQAHNEPTDNESARTGGTDPQVLAMARALDRTGRKVTDLDKHVRQLAADVAQIAKVVAANPSTTGDKPVNGSGNADDEGEESVPEVRSWLLATDPDLAVADLADLIEWLDGVYLRYHATSLPSCWLWHPDVVEELWWLRKAHANAYDPELGSWQRVGDWHDRQRPGVVKRINTAVGACDLTQHQPGKPHGRPPVVAPLAGHAEQVAEAWTTGQRSHPQPSREQLDEAQEYLHDLHQGYR